MAVAGAMGPVGNRVVLAALLSSGCFADPHPQPAPPDRTAPETRLLASPPAQTDQSVATFRFDADEPAGFFCRHGAGHLMMRTLRLYLDDVTLWFATLDPTALAAAESLFASGELAHAAGNYGSAIQNFLDAHAQAQPCSGDSFGANAEGLEGGGC